MSKHTVIIGATPNKNRYAYYAAQDLKKNDYDFSPVGIKKGIVEGKEILDLRQKPNIKDVHTVTIYLNPTNQRDWEEYILSLNPKRIIFNPGTENPNLLEKAEKKNIEAIYACTLVMLSVGTY
jgi:hypothetical protein